MRMRVCIEILGDFPPLENRKVVLLRMVRHGSLAQHKGAMAARTGEAEETRSRHAFAPTTAQTAGERANRLLGTREAARSHLSVSTWRTCIQMAPGGL